MKAIVTGGAGFIGSHVVDLLVSDGVDVVIVDNLSTGQEAYLNPKAKLVRADIRQTDAWKHEVKDCDYFFHLAALPRIQPSFDEPVEHEDVNVIGTIRCLEAVKGSGIKKFVYSSSSAIYGNTERIPTPEDTPPQLLNPYALEKYAGEQYALILGERFAIPVIALRYFNVYGPRSFNPKNPFNAYSSVIGIFNDQCRRGVPLTVTGDGSQRRDCIHVTDVARANYAAARSTLALRSYNVGCGNNYSVQEVAELFSPNITHIAERKGEARVTVADVSRIADELNWKASIDLPEGVRLMKQLWQAAPPSRRDTAAAPEPRSEANASL